MHGRGRVVSDRIKQRTAEYGDYLKSLKTGVPVQRRPPGRRRSTTPPPDVTAPFAD
jgi:hypothetical protein